MQWTTFQDSKISINCLDICQFEEIKQYLDRNSENKSQKIEDHQTCLVIYKLLASKNTDLKDLLQNAPVNIIEEDIRYDQQHQQCYFQTSQQQKSKIRILQGPGGGGGGRGGGPPGGGGEGMPPQNSSSGTGSTDNSSSSNQQSSSSSTSASQQAVIYQNQQLCAAYTNCFDCSWTSGTCAWLSESQKCAYVNKTITNINTNWPYLYQNCTDTFKLCKTNVSPYSSSTIGVVSGSKYYFQIAPNATDGTSTIPKNYFCNWTFSTDSANTYSMVVNRYKTYTAETLTMRLRSDSNEDNLTDSYLQTSDSSQSTTLRILNPKLIFIYARNKYAQQNETFIVTLEAETVTDSTSVFGVISLVLFILMAVFICICVAAIIRVCMRKRRIEQNLRNQVQQRQQQDQHNQSHEDRFKSLIELLKEKKYDKRIDEYKQNECVICFEEFQKGAMIRKIPICKHVFHTNCIDDWFKSKIAEASHKCPLCNTEVTIEKVKEAIKKRHEEQEQKRQKKINAVIPQLEKNFSKEIDQQQPINMSVQGLRQTINDNIADIMQRQNRAAADIQRMGVIDYQNNSNSSLVRGTSNSNNLPLSTNNNSQRRVYNPVSGRTLAIQPVFENNESNNPLNGPFGRQNSRVVDL